LPWLPILGGERCLKKNLWHLVPSIYRKRFQIELALNFFCRQCGLQIGCNVIHDLRHRSKEYKRGLLQRLLMIGDIVAIAAALYMVESVRLPVQFGNEKKEFGAVSPTIYIIIA